MKIIFIAIILLITHSICQTKNEKCVGCPTWAESMTPKEWDDWREQDAEYRDQLSKENISLHSQQSNEHSGAKFGASLITVGAIMEILAIAIVKDQPKEEDYRQKSPDDFKNDVDSARKLGKASKTLSIIGYSMIALGGITISFSF